MPIVALFDGTGSVINTTSTISKLQRIRDFGVLHEIARGYIRPFARIAPPGAGGEITGSRFADMLIDRAALMRTQIDNWQILGRKFDSLRTAVSALSRPESFVALSAQSSLPESVEILSIGGRAEVGEYKLAISQLAQAHSIASDVQENIYAPLGKSGVVLINGTKINITPSDSLVDIKNAINETFTSRALSSNKAIVDAVAGARAAAGRHSVAVFQLAVSEKMATSSSDALSARAEPSANVGSYQIVIKQLAHLDREAVISVDGVDYSRPTNTIDDVIEGVALTLLDSRPNETISLTIKETEIPTRPAILSVDGRVFARGSNVISDVIQGVTLRLNGLSPEGQSTVITIEEVPQDTGVEATISANQLILTNRRTGHQGISLVDDNNVLMSLGILTTDDLGRIVPKNELVAAQDAVLTVNGESFEKVSNTFDDVIPGVEVQLKGVPSEGVTIDVRRDVDPVISGIEAFVDGYNDLMRAINRQLAFRAELFTDPTLRRVRGDVLDDMRRPVSGLPEEINDITKIGLIFVEEGRVEINELSLKSLLMRIQSDLADLTTRAVDGVPTILNSLDKIGILSEENGTLAIDRERLARSIEEHPDEVEALFASEDGVAQRLIRRLDQILASGIGTIAYRQSAISALFQEDGLSQRGRETLMRIERRRAELLNDITILNEILAMIRSRESFLLEQMW